MKFLRVAAVAAALLVGVTAGQAAFTLKLSDTGGNSVTVIDNNAAGTQAVNLGQLGAGNTSGSATKIRTSGFDTLDTPTSNTTGIRYGTGSDTSGVYLGFTSTLISTSTLGKITSTSNTVIGNLTGVKRTVTLEISADLTTPGAIGTYLNLKQNITVLNFYDSMGGISTNSNNKLKAFTRATPDLVDTPTLTFTGGPGGGSSQALFYQTASPYSLTQYITITLDAGEYISLQADTLVVPVPAPPAIVLAALGIPALGLVRRWTRKTTAGA